MNQEDPTCRLCNNPIVVAVVGDEKVGSDDFSWVSFSSPFMHYAGSKIVMLHDECYLKLIIR